MSSTDDEMRDFANDLFAGATEDDLEEPAPRPRNVVAREGHTATPPADDDVRNFVRDLFGTHQDH